jgi:glycosyltransferase involved in cell wall biosynthesis
VIRGCFRDSPVQSAVLATSIMIHRGIGTYQSKVSRFIALTENSRQKLIEAGLPAAKIRIKPNFVEWSKPPAQGPRQGGLFVGRLSVEKGIEVLLDAVARLGPDQGELTIMGTGPLQQNVTDVLQGRYLGFQALEAVQQAMEKALFMVMPSIWYEGFPRTLVEAFACGLPVIASRMGAMAEVIDDQQTGLLFEPGNAQEFAEKIRWALQHPQEMQAMGQRARKVFESRYDKETNHTLLTGIYREAIEEAAASPAKASAGAS